MRVAIVLCLLAAAGACVALGFWQLDRANEKRAIYTAAVARFAQPALEDMSGGDTWLPGRRIRLRGSWDGERHILLSGRTHGGAAGVLLVTPLVLPSGVRVLVERGWLAADDARTAHPERWIDSTAVVEGVIHHYPVPRRVVPWSALESERQGTALWSARALDLREVRAHVPAPVADGWVLAMVPPKDTAAARPGLVTTSYTLPESGVLMHEAYAIQWFVISLILAVGAIALVRRRDASAAR